MLSIMYLILLNANRTFGDYEVAEQPAPQEKPSFLRNVFLEQNNNRSNLNHSWRRISIATYGMNVEGSAFDMEGGLPLGTTYERMQIEQQMKKVRN